jgi:methionyl aminopeptidase
MRPRVALSRALGSRKIGSDFPVEPGIVSPMQTVPSHIGRPEYASNGRPHSASYGQVFTYAGAELEKMRSSAKLAREMLEFSCSLVKPGISTDEIDRRTFEEIIKKGAYPSPINYAGFPKAICTSVNEVCCHGIPDSRELREGDVIAIDVSIFKDGVHGDNCKTVIAGEGDEAAHRLINATEEALNRAISVCGPTACLSDIGEAIEQVAANNDLRIIHEFCGHGLGSILHMYPLIKHFRNYEKLPLVPGMVFTIEPILVEGSRKITTWDDGWTAVCVDGGRSAQFEHEVLITENGAEVITVI